MRTVSSKQKYFYSVHLDNQKLTFAFVLVDVFNSTEKMILRTFSAQHGFIQQNTRGKFSYQKQSLINSYIYYIVLMCVDLQNQAKFSFSLLQDKRL